MHLNFYSIYLWSILNTIRSLLSIRLSFVSGFVKTFYKKWNKLILRYFSYWFRRKNSMKSIDISTFKWDVEKMLITGLLVDNDR